MFNIFITAYPMELNDPTSFARYGIFKAFVLINNMYQKLKQTLYFKK